MKKFLLKLPIFLIPFIIAYVIIEHKITHIPNNRALKNEYLQREASHIQVLVLGSSHVLYGVNPAFITPKTFNLAYHLQPLHYDCAITEKYLNKLTDLKLVLISLDYFSFDYNIHNQEYDYEYHLYYGLKYTGWRKWDIRTHSAIAMHSLSWTMDQIKSGFTQEHDNFVDTNGYLKFSVPFDTTDFLQHLTDSSAMLRISFLDKEMDHKDRKGIVNELEHLIELLQKKNIHVVLFTTPVCHIFSDHIDKNILSKNDTLINVLCAKYGLRYYNYLNDKRFTLYDFQDNDHVNPSGAEKLSRIIDTEIVKPLLQ